MTVRLLEGGLPVEIQVDERISFAVEWGPDGTAVEITYDTGCDARGGCGTHEVCLTISREDWEAVVAHVALPRFEHRSANA
jgi:hypothetical protein